MNLQQYKIPAIALAIGLAVGYFLLPHKTKIETREVVKTVVQEVVKEKKNTVTKTVYVKQKDGTETTTTETVDTGVIDSSKQASSETLKEKIVTSNGVGIGVFAINEISKLTIEKPAIGLLIDIPIASKASVFILGDTDKRIGLGVKVQF